MPKLNKYQIQKVNLIKERVFLLYKDGYSTRQIRDIIDKERSHAWIAIIIKEKEAENIDKQRLN